MVEIKPQLGSFSVILIFFMIMVAPMWAQDGVVLDVPVRHVQSTSPTLAADDSATSPSSTQVNVITSTETAYNAQGTTSPSRFALISTRREDPEFRGFLLGLQAAAIDEFGAPLNVAPLTAKTLEEQADALQGAGVELFIVDSPDPADAKAFFESSADSGRRATLITQDLPKGYRPPYVVDSPFYYGEVASEEAIRTHGNVSVTVAVIGAAEAMASEEPTDLRQSWLQFKRVMDHVAPNIKLEPIDPETYQPGFQRPQIVAALTRLDSVKYSGRLRSVFPDSTIILMGESDQLRRDFEQGLFDVRVRPDYIRLLVNAVREERRSFEMPIILRPAAERRAR